MTPLTLLQILSSWGWEEAGACESFSLLPRTAGKTPPLKTRAT